MCVYHRDHVFEGKRSGSWILTDATLWGRHRHGFRRKTSPWAPCCRGDWAAESNGQVAVTVRLVSDTPTQTHADTLTYITPQATSQPFRATSLTSHSGDKIDVERKERQGCEVMKTRWKTKGYHEQHWQRKDNVCGCGMKLLRDTFYNQFSTWKVHTCTKGWYSWSVTHAGEESRRFCVALQLTRHSGPSAPQFPRSSPAFPKLRGCSLYEIELRSCQQLEAFWIKAEMALARRAIRTHTKF